MKRLLALLLVSAGSLAAGQLDLKANEQPVTVQRNAAAIAKIPADYHFVEPGTLTVAISALNSPPLALVASDKSHTHRQRSGYRPFTGAKPRFKAQAGANRMGRLAAGHYFRAL